MTNNIAYFSHMTNAHQHFKLKTLRREYARKFNLFEGWGGEAKFWVLNSYIANADYCKLDLANTYLVQSIAADIDFDMNEWNWFLDVVINKTKLAYMEDDRYLLTEMTQDNLIKVSAVRQQKRDWMAKDRLKKQRAKAKQSSTYKPKVEHHNPNVDDQTPGMGGDYNALNGGQSNSAGIGPLKPVDLPPPDKNQTNKVEFHNQQVEFHTSKVEGKEPDVGSPPGETGLNESLSDGNVLKPGQNQNTESQAGGGFSQKWNSTTSKVEFHNEGVVLENGGNGSQNTELRTFPSENGKKNSGEMVSEDRNSTTESVENWGTWDPHTALVEHHNRGNGIHNENVGIPNSAKRREVFTDSKLSVPAGPAGAGNGAAKSGGEKPAETHSPESGAAGGGATGGEPGGNKIAAEAQKLSNAGISRTVEGDGKGQGLKTAKNASRKNPESEPFWQNLVGVMNSTFQEFVGKKPPFKNSPNPKRLHEIVQQVRMDAQAANIEWNQANACSQVQEFFRTGWEESDFFNRDPRKYTLHNLAKLMDGIIVTLNNRHATTQLSTGSHQSGTTKGRTKRAGTSDDRMEALKNWSL